MSAEGGLWERHQALIIPATAALASASVALMISHDQSLAAIGLGAIVLLLAFIRPRFGLLILVAVLLVFHEETWQLRYLPSEYGGTMDYVETFYTYRVVGLSILSVLIGALLVRSLLGRGDRPRPRFGVFEVWLLMFVALAVIAEVVGRFTVPYAGSVFGQWSQIVLPIIAAFVLARWCDTSDIKKGIDVLATVAFGRLLYGLGRLALGGGDYNMSVGRRGVFWDSADGFIGVLAVSFGIAWLLDRTSSRRRRAAATLLVAAGGAVILLSYRRQAMVAVAVAAFLTTTLLHRWKALVGSVAFVVLLLGGAMLVSPDIITESAVGQRASSIVTTGSATVTTNDWHYSDVEDALLNIADNPILGYGFHVSPPRRTYELTSRDASLEVIGVYHNVFLNVWFRMGVVGLIALVGILWCSLRSGVVLAWREMDVTASALTGALAGLVVSGTIAPIFASDRAPLLFFCGLMALVVMARERAEAKTAAG